MATHASDSWPGEFHGQRSQVGYSPWIHKELDMTNTYTHTHTYTHMKKAQNKKLQKISIDV